MAYITSAEVKSYLDIDTIGDDSIIADCILAAQAAVDAYCGRTFEASTNTVRYFDAIYDTEGGRDLHLSADLCSINSVTNGDGTTVTSGQYTTVPKNVTPYHTIHLLPSSGVAWTYTTDHENAIQISGKWSYSTTAPEPVQWATLRLAAWLYRQRDNSALVDQTQVMPSGAVLLPGKLPPDVMQLLDPYRRDDV